MTDYQLEPGSESCTTHSPVYAGFGKVQSRLFPTLLWLCLLAWVARVTLFLRQRGLEEFAAVDISAGVQAMIVFFMCLLLMTNSRVLSMCFRLVRTSAGVLFLYYLVCTISAAWSPMPLYSLYRGFEFIASLIAVFVALSYSPGFAAAERKVLLISFVTLVFAMYVNLKFYGLKFSFSAWHTNSYSASAAMIFCYCLGEYFSGDKERARMLIPYGIFSLVAVIIGTSAASNVAVLCGTIVAAILLRKVFLGLFVLWLLLLILAISMFGVNLDFMTAAVFPGKAEHQILTVGGRLLMWKTYLLKILESPVFGHGFAALSSARGSVFASHPHSSVLSVLLGAGAFGALAFTIYVVRLFRELLRTNLARLPGAVGCASAMVAGLVNSLAMPLVGDQWEESSLVFAGLTALFILYVYSAYLPEVNKLKRARAIVW